MKKAVLVASLFAVALCVGSPVMADPPDDPAANRWRLADSTIKQANLDLNALQKFYNKAQTLVRALDKRNPMAPVAEIERESERQYEQCIATMTLTAVSAAANFPECQEDCAGEYLPEFFACSTFAHGEDVCSPVGSLVPNKSPNTDTEYCRVKVARMRLLKDSLAHGHASMPFCEQDYQLELHNPDAAHQLCQIIVQGLPVDETCAKAVPLLRSFHAGEAGKPVDRWKVDMDWCRVEVNSLRGTQDCSVLDPKGPQADTGIIWMCQLSSAFKKAFEAHSPNSCGDSGMCRVMMTGDIKACNSYVSEFRQKVCAAILKQRKKEDSIKVAQLKITIKEGGGVSLLSDDQIQSLRPDIDDALARGSAGGTTQAKAMAELTKLAQGQKPANASLRGVLMDIVGLKQAAVKWQIDQAQSLLDGAEPKSGSDYEERKANVVELRDKFQGMTVPDISDVK